jgi:hypothetical protein
MFTPPPVVDEDKPKLEFTKAVVQGNKAVYVPNPDYLGKTLILTIKQAAQFDARQDDGTTKEKTAIDTESIVVVETGEVFEGQRIFQTGIVRQLKNMAPGSQVIASLGTYTVQGRKGEFVQLIAPNPEQQQRALAYLAQAQPAAPAAAAPAANDAPF